MIKKFLYVLSSITLLISITIFSPSRYTAQTTVPRFRLNEQYANSLFRKGLALYHSQRYNASRELFYKALEIYPQFHLSRRYLGDSYYYSGNWGNALEQWEFLNKVSNNNYPLIKERSQLLRQQLVGESENGKYTFLRSFSAKDWRIKSFKGPTDISFTKGGEMYLNSFSSANVLRLSSSANLLEEISIPFYNSLGNPMGNTVDASGRLYVCDYKKDNVRVFSSTRVSSGTKELLSFGKSGSGKGEFHGPSNIISHKNFLFVSDSGNNRIQKFNNQGRFLLEMGRNAGIEPISHPTGLAISKDQVLYVADRDSGRILRFDLDGNFLGEINSLLLKKPRGLSINKNTLIIADEESGIIFYHLINKTWSLLKDKMTKGGSNKIRNNEALITRPFAASINRSGILYVSDYGTNRLLSFVPIGIRTSNLSSKIIKIEKTNFPLISVFVSAKDRLGHDLHGLSKHNFQLYENDIQIKKIKTDNIKAYNKHSNIALVKENSFFYTENYENYLKSALGALFSFLNISDTLYAIEAGQDARLIYQGLEKRHILKLLARKENKSKSPNISKGIYEAITRLIPKLGSRSVIFLSSGKHYPKAFAQYKINRLTQFALAHSIPIHIISYEGEQRDPKKKALVIKNYKKIARITGGRYFRAFEENKLSQIYKIINNHKDQRYIVTYNTSISPSFKGRYLGLRLTIEYAGTRGIADSGYFIP